MIGCFLWPLRFADPNAHLVSEWVISFIQTYGLPAVALLMFLENVFPPLPSELIMPFAGFAAARGHMNVVLVALAGALGSVAGAVVWYWVGRRFGVEVVQRWAADHGTYLLSREDEAERDGELTILPAKDLAKYRLVDFLDDGDSFDE